MGRRGEYRLLTLEPDLASDESTPDLRDPPSDEWLVITLFMIMGKDVKTNISGTMTTDTTFPTLRYKVREYATLMGGPSSLKCPAPMDID